MSREIEAFLTAHDTAINLEFIRSPSGSVHVVHPLDPTEHQPSFTIQYMLGRTRTACGRWFRLKLVGGDCDGVTEFADEDLCGNCHRALGTHSDRAFEHPLPRP